MNYRTHYNGRKLLTPQEYQKRAKQLAEASTMKPLPAFGGVSLPYASAVENFLVFGVPGAGKSTLIDILMKSVLPGYVGTNADHRALIHDHSGESVSVMYNLGFTFENGFLKTLNPFDRRSVAWDIAQDITAPSLARQFARIVIPDNPKVTDPFWNNAARNILAGVLISMNERYPRQWNLRDVIQVCLFEEESFLIELLGWSRINAPQVRLLSSPAEKMTSSILEVLRTVLTDYIEIAALWCYAKEKVTVSSFLQGSYVLLLGAYQTVQSTLETVNRLFLARLIDEILTSKHFAEDAFNPRRTWIIIDEGSKIGKVEGMLDLLDLGRKYGVSTVVSYHDISQVEEHYDEQHESFLAKFGNKAFLRLEDVKTPKWASDFFGTSEFIHHDVSTSENMSNNTFHDEPYGAFGNQNIGKTLDESIRDAQLIPSNVFASFPRVWETGTIKGCFSTCVGASLYTINSDYLHQHRIGKTAGVLTQDFYSLDEVVFPFWGEGLRSPYGVMH